jgi:hypothetical protein
VGSVLTALAHLNEQPTDLVYDRDNGDLYITGRTTIYQYDIGAASLTQQTPSGFSGDITATAYDYDNRMFYLSNGNSVYRYDYGTNSLGSPVTSSGMTDATSMTYDHDNKDLYLTGRTTVYQYDTRNDSVTSHDVGSSTGGRTLTATTYDYDGRNLYLTDKDTSNGRSMIYRYDYGNNQVTPVTPTPLGGIVTRFVYDSQDRSLRLPTRDTLYRYDTRNFNVTSSTQNLDPLDNPTGVATAVPEPASIAVWCFAALGIFGLSMRRRK